MSNDERNNEQDFKERKFVIGRQELKKITVFKTIVDKKLLFT